MEHSYAHDVLDADAEAHDAGDRRRAPAASRAHDARAARFDPFECYPEGHERAGEYVTRMWTCTGCGSEFEQHQLSELWANWTQRRGFFAERALADALPGGWTPRSCPRCERRALAR